MQILQKLKNWLLLCLIILLFFINSTAGSLISLLCIVFILFNDHRLLKMFKNWGFIIFVILILGVPVIFDLSLKTFQDNFLMLTRGILILFLLYFTLNDLASTRVYSKVEKYLPEEILNTVKVALKMLPIVKEQFLAAFAQRKKSNLSVTKSIINLLSSFITIADKLAIELEAEKKPDIYFITGKIHEGKSTLAYTIASEAINKGIKVGGIISQSNNHNNNRTGYDVIDLKSGKSVPLATNEPIENCEETCGQYYFYPEGMKFASNSLDPDYLKESIVVFVDEVGRLELSKHGFYSHIIKLLSSDLKAIFLVLREDFIEAVKEKFNVTPQKIITVSNEENNNLELIYNKLLQ